MKKYHPLAELKKIIKKEKEEGKIVVLANGCFDLLHAGHIHYLKGAKKLGDILVVAMNSDSSVRKLKGKGRPLLGEEERMEILSSFSCVDYLTIFDEKTVEKVLRALKPHLHVKGSDYSEESVPEKDIVKSYGGKVAIAGGPKVRSTSEIINKILSLKEKRGTF